MSTDKFIKHFKIPKSEINRIKKEYNTAKEANDQITPEKLKCYEDFGKEVFDFFEEIAGKKVNRDLMIGHLSYYFDEGFDPEDMIGYMRKQISDVYYQSNPERFTIAQLFPLKDQDRINITWDNLSYYQGIRNAVNKDLIGGVVLTLKCGHQKLRAAWMQNSCCEDCIISGNEVEIIQNPYIAISLVTDESLQELAWFFMRHDEDKTILDYSNRTWDRRSEIYKKNNIKASNPSTILMAGGL